MEAELAELVTAVSIALVSSDLSALRAAARTSAI